MEGVMSDPEYDWLVRTGINAYNVYLTMIHFLIHESIVDFDEENAHAIVYPLFMAAIDFLVYLSMD